jgi:NAD(P)-dependent dehydrogenase (short-subunit alcohol dehydrogenase family)
MPFTGAYGPSKFAIESLTAVMRMEFAPFGVHVAVIAPGPIDTPMAARIQEELAVEPSIAVYREPLRRFRQASRKSFAEGIPIEKVVATIVEAVESPKPRRRYELHQNFLRDVVLMRMLPTGWREAIVRRRLALNPLQTP